MLLCAGHCISVLQPNRRCETLLQRKCDHSIVCHEVMFLLLKVFQSALPIVTLVSYSRSDTKNSITGHCLNCTWNSAISNSTVVLSSVKQQVATNPYH